MSSLQEIKYTALWSQMNSVQKTKAWPRPDYGTNPELIV